MSAVKQRAIHQASPAREKNPVRRIGKSADAFRTISEVADDLEVPQHVLRFWETKFPQIQPLKRGGGRRYYRPEDVDLLRAVRGLLYDQGYTIKGVQKLLRDGNLRLDGGRVVEALPSDAPAAIIEAEAAIQAEMESLPLFKAGLSDQQIAELKLITDELVDLRDRLSQILNKN